MNRNEEGYVLVRKSMLYGVDVEGCMRLEDYENGAGVKLKPKSKMQARKGYCSRFSFK